MIVVRHIRIPTASGWSVDLGLAVTRDGFPIRRWIFPGNTVDVTTVQRVKRERKGWRLNRCVFVGDAGMVSKDNLTQLA